MREVTFQQAYPMALRAAQVRSAAAVATAGLPAHEREDLEQEALMAVWRALPQYDPSRACLRTFIERVIASRFASLLRARRRQLTLVPLDGQHLVTRDGIPVVEFRNDLQRVVGSLAERDRRLTLRLMEHTPTETSRSLGIARSTVYEHLRRIRTAFVDAGLGPQKARRP
ncbi:MAG: sigma-70 family RNA polymerase sigma factor [Acidobacteria bacterium]|nr:sigma-70 family RNA polymerase sigma factor [Acidobacteriota bacterium]